MAVVSGDTWDTDTPIPAQTGGTTVHFVIEAFNDEPASTVTDEQSYFLAQVVSVYDRTPPVISGVPTVRLEIATASVNPTLASSSGTTS